jgi:hypothetical protein
MAEELLEGWAIALIAISAILIALYLLSRLVGMWARRAYRHFLNNPKTQCDIDAFVSGGVNTETGEEKNNNNPCKALKVVMLSKFTLGSRVANVDDPIALEVIDSTHVPNLLVTQKAGTAAAAAAAPASPTTPAQQVVATSIDEILEQAQRSGKTPIIVGTIRMGFGHHRIAYSVCSWALSQGYTTIFHDLLNIVPSAESALISDTDALYSKFSRWASEIGGPVERFWGSLMLSGDADALRVASLTAAHLQPLLLAYPKTIPIICTHQLVALTAAAIGFTNVVNLVVDNHPQWFLTVPRTLNLVQGPVNYESFLLMGVKPSELAWAGHWCPESLVSNIPVDCQRRLQRAKNKNGSTTASTTYERAAPLRILIPVGGAGAQRKFIIQFCKALSPLVQTGQVQLMLNAGDHEHMKTAFLQLLDECNLDFEVVSDSAGVRAFQERLLTGSTNVEPNKNVTLFSFHEYFPAVATTDMLMRIADVLACKPSELAFYCLPKLHIRRVGDHEADSAKRSSELGDGTLEAREIEDAMHYIDLFLNSGPDLLSSMNQAIMRNHEIGVYNGCQKAVELAVQVAAAKTQSH